MVRQRRFAILTENIMNKQTETELEARVAELERRIDELEQVLAVLGTNSSIVDE